jgi:hypothetical protein
VLAWLPGPQPALTIDKVCSLAGAPAFSGPGWAGSMREGVPSTSQRATTKGVQPCLGTALIERGCMGRCRRCRPRWPRRPSQRAWARAWPRPGRPSWRCALPAAEAVHVLVFCPVRLCGCLQCMCALLHAVKTGSVLGWVSALGRHAAWRLHRSWHMLAWPKQARAEHAVSAMSPCLVYLLHGL